MSTIEILTGAKNSNGGGFVDVMSKSTFIFSNPDVNTGIALNATPTAIDFTKAAMVIDNPLAEDLSQAQTFVIDHIKLRCDAAGADATKAILAFFIDDINRYSSGGTKLVGNPATCGAADGIKGTPSANVYFGDVTTLSPSAANVKVNTQLIKSDTTSAPCFSIDDEFFFSTQSQQSVTDADGVVSNAFKLPLMYIKPGGSLTVLPLFPNQTAAASFEIEVSLFEI